MKIYKNVIMLIDLVKGVLLGALLWLSLFITGAVISILAAESFAGISKAIATPFITVILSWYYLKSQEISNKLSESLKLGFVWVIVSLCLDFAVTAFILGRGFLYFLSLSLWGSYVEMILFPTAVGYILLKTKRRWLRE
jgi:hypothetical protein